MNFDLLEFLLVQVLDLVALRLHASRLGFFLANRSDLFFSLFQVVEGIVRDGGLRSIWCLSRGWRTGHVMINDIGRRQRNRARRLAAQRMRRNISNITTLALKT